MVLLLLELEVLLLNQEVLFLNLLELLLDVLEVFLALVVLPLEGDEVLLLLGELADCGFAEGELFLVPIDLGMQGVELGFLEFVLLFVLEEVGGKGLELLDCGG